MDYVGSNGNAARYVSAEMTTIFADDTNITLLTLTLLLLKRKLT